MLSKKRIQNTVLILAIVAALIALVLSGVYFYQRVRLFYSRPLVLIFNPINREHIPLEGITMINANARTKAGVQRVELWVDDAFVYAQEANEVQGALSSETIMVPWEPVGAGKHTILVRAISVNGVDGQTSVGVYVDEPPAEQGVEGAGASPDSEDQDGEVLTSGGGVSGGGGGPPSGGAPSPPAGEPPPSPGSSPPGSIEDIADDLGIEPGDSGPGTMSDEPIGVRVEALGLHSSGSYESLHCYIEAGPLSPQWYPDDDHDQSTDESFASPGAGDWDIASHLGNENGPFIMWPGNEPLPLNLTCVGIYGGGVESDELGHVNISAGPDLWDNVIRQAESRGGEGSFSVDYRFSIGAPGGPGFPIELDPNMSSPFNLQISDANELTWEWEPSIDPEPEEPPDGFYIYLNGSRQFVVGSGDSRSIVLPPEWGLPPCGLGYVYSATAWRYNPDNPSDNYESYPSEPLVISRDLLEECNVRAYITFETLTIHGLSRSPDEGRTDAMGPVVVGVSACSSGHCIAESGVGTCYPYTEDCGYRLQEDLPYSMAEIMALSGKPNHYFVPLSEEGVDLGYFVWNQNSTDTSLWCEGATLVPGDLIFSEDGSIEEYRDTLHGESGRTGCDLEYVISSELITSDYRGFEFPPLPSLVIDEVIPDEASGGYRIVIRNASDGTWAGYDLEVLMARNSGDEVHRFILPEFNLEPGASTSIFSVGMHDVERPLDMCVSLDPDNAVTESVERSNPGWHAQPYCLDLPDLTITNAGFDNDNRTMVVVLHNHSDNELLADSVHIEVDNLAEGTRHLHTLDLADGRIGPWESQRVRITLLAEPLPSYIARTNYLLIADPVDAITELDEDNNTFDFSEFADTFELHWDGFDYGDLDVTSGGYTWTGLYVPYYDIDDEHNYDHFYATVYIENGVSRREVGTMDVACTIPRGLRDRGPTAGCQSGTGPIDVMTFDLAYGETVSVSVRGYVKSDPDDDLFTRMGSFWLHYSDNNGGGWCNERHQPYGEVKWGYVYPSVSWGPWPWYSGLTLCRVGP